MLDVLLDWQAISRDSMEEGNHGAERYPFVSMAIRVESFSVLNTYLGATNAGRLRHMDQDFPADMALAGQICRAIRAADLVRPRN